MPHIFDLKSRNLLLEFKSVSSSYGPDEARRDVSISVTTDEMMTPISANGAGKSTLLMTIFGEPRLGTGSIWLEGSDISQVASCGVYLMGISQVPKGRRVFQSMTLQ